MDWGSPGLEQKGTLTGDGGYLLTAGDLGQWKKPIEIWKILAQHAKAVTWRSKICNIPVIVKVRSQKSLVNLFSARVASIHGASIKYLWLEREGVELN